MGFQLEVFDVAVEVEEIPGAFRRRPLGIIGIVGVEFRRAEQGRVAGRVKRAELVQDPEFG